MDETGEQRAAEGRYSGGAGMGYLSPMARDLCARLHDYAESSAGRCGYRSPFNALLVVAGEEHVLAAMHRPIEREPGIQMALDDFIGCPLDDERICGLFDYMNEKAGPDGSVVNGHRDGAILFDEEGRVIRAGMRVVGCPEFDGMETVYRRAMEIKGGGEVGTRHTTAASMSRVQGVVLGAALSESAGTMIPFVGGNIAEGFVYDPKSGLELPGYYEPEAAVPTGDPVKDSETGTCMPAWRMWGRQG